MSQPLDTPTSLEDPRTSIPCNEPATGVSLGRVDVTSPAQVREAIARARAAQVSWAKTSFEERRRVLRHMLREVLEHVDELVDALCRDAGKTRENALLGEIWPVCEKLRWTIAHGEEHLRPEPMSSGLLVHKKAWVEYPALGVIGIICPWNFPLQNILGPTIPALFAGNAVVVKVSEWVAWSGTGFAEFVHRVLRETGHSVDLVQIVQGYAATGAALVGGGVDKVLFTGSVENGRRVLAESAATLTPVVLELGGKDPMIVCDDADLDQAAHAAMAGTCIASGQMCMATERIYVFDAVHDEFVDRVVGIASSLRQGPPTGSETVDVGAMTMPGQIEIVRGLVDDAVQKGARVLVGGRPRSDGQFFEPTVLVGVEHGMAIVEKETFGPVVCIVRVRDEDHAIELANDSEFGLSSSVFSKDPERAQRIARQLVAGSTVVNDFGLHYMAQDLPFGGVRASGFGRLNGREGLRACTNPKAMIADRVPMHRSAKLFPVAPGDYELTREAIRTVYRSGSDRVWDALELGRRLWSRLRGSA